MVSGQGVREATTAGASTRETILEAALEIFAERGYDGVSVRELNRRLGASHNLIHHHFGSKRKLWEAAVEFGLSRSRDAFQPLESAGPEADLAELLTNGIRQFIQMTAQHPAMPRIFEQEASQGGDRLDYILEHHTAPLVRGTLGFLEGLADASARDLDFRSVSLFVGSGLTAFFRQAPLARRLGGPDPFSPEGIEANTRTVIEILLYGLVGRRTCS